MLCIKWYENRKTLNPACDLLFKSFRCFSENPQWVRVKTRHLPPTDTNRKKAEKSKEEKTTFTNVIAIEADIYLIDR